MPSPTACAVPCTSATRGSRSIYRYPPPPGVPRVPSDLPLPSHRPSPDPTCHLVSLLLALERHDGYSTAHSVRVARLALAFTAWLGWPEPARAAVQQAALLHDLGKLRVPRSVLLKPGPLTPAERAQVHRHPVWSARLARALGASGPVLAALLAHHERWDGQGYPHGLPGEAVPLLARLLAVVDAFDAMTSLRPYAAVRTPGEALAELERGAGSHFDPQLAPAFARFARAEEGFIADVVLEAGSPCPDRAEAGWT